MHSSERPPINSLFKKSVLDWRAAYLASKATTEQAAEEKPVATSKPPLKIRRARRVKARC